MKKNLWGLMAMLMMLLSLPALTSCGDDDDSAPVNSTVLTVKNQAGYTLTNLRVYFYNKSSEKLDNLGNGDLQNGQSTSFTVPSGTYLYYFVCIDQNGEVRISPDYYWEDTKSVTISSLSSWYI